MELDQTRPHEIADAIAPGWERWRAFVEEVCAGIREWMISELAPRPGATVLELAAGAGDTGFEAAGIAGARGRLICSDFSPAMLDVARRRGAELGVENVEYRLIDAERIELETDSVDGALCRFGYMLMADPAAALAETRRVLRPGGRLALAVWGPPERNPCFTNTATALIEGGHVPPPAPGEPSVFSLSDAERLSGLLREAGFAAARVEELPVRFAFGDLDEYLRFSADTAGPFGLAIRGLSDRERAALELRLERAFGPFAAGRGYRLPGIALAAAAS